MQARLCLAVALLPILSCTPPGVLDAGGRDAAMDVPGADVPGADAPGIDVPGADVPGAEVPGAEDAGPPSADTGPDVAFPLDAPDALTPRPTHLCSVPAPRVLWLEPDGISNWLGRRSRVATDDDVRELVRAAHRRGFETLVLAYVQHINCFYYHSAIRTPFPVLEFRSGPPSTTTYVPADAYCPHAPAGGYVELIYEEADRLGMTVIAGLGKAGDDQITYDLEAYYRAPDPLVLPVLSRRISDVVTRNLEVAEELLGAFGDRPAFGGFYLSHEPACLDVAANVWQPISDGIATRRPGTFLLASPPGAFQVCIGTDTVATYLDRLRLSAVAYQDAIGAGTDSMGRYTCTDTARDARIAGLPAAYAAIRGTHTGSAAAMWANVEAWNMTGLDPDGMTLPAVPPSTCGYGYNHAGPLARVIRQIDAVDEIVDAVMINEAHNNFLTAGYEHEHPFWRTPAEAFTTAYDACLR